MNYVYQTVDNATYYALSDEDIHSINTLVDTKYNTWDWNFGKSPTYSFKNDLKFTGGNIHLNLDVSKGIITNIKFYGDFFGKCDISFIEELLVDCKHEESEIVHTLKDIDINDYLLGADLNILTNLLLGAK